ncbi:Protein curvature thylakoid 1B, chloroplastic [Vitis vinifera]|uniref:Protein curvature thylakoid 1B, chloroplastic n=1 Tax=Vitis vinifera TaxID=29760 RepID=A0A438DQF3_VITVI|nr:Protein curvature thylakoid 1B, chloroplastic [Vitis vinifera]
MASTTTPLSISSSSTLIDGKAPRQSAAASSQCVTLPTLPPPPVPSQHRPGKAPLTVSRKIARNVIAMATGEAPAEVGTTEVPEIIKTVQEAWDKVEDKYAVSSLAAAGFVGLWVSTGMVSAIDKLPLVPVCLRL